MRSYLCRLTALSLLAGGITLAAPPLSMAANAPGAPTDWTNWRGPHYDGSSDATGLPEKFGKDAAVAWKAKLPGPGNSTPIVAGDRVFISAIDANRKMHAVGLNRADGKIVFDHVVGTSQISGKGENDVASPSAVTDGKVVVFMFGTGDVAAFNPADGKPLWMRNLQREIGEFNVNWIYGSSPTLYKGKLYIQVLHTDKPYTHTQLPGAAKYDGETPSYLLALDPMSGKEIFRVTRPTEAVKETRESYATPIPYTNPQGREEILLVGGDAVTGHDPETGKELWRFTGWDPQKEPFWRLIPSVVAGGAYIFACAPKNGPVMAIKAGGEGDVSQSHKAWWSDGKKMTSDVAVPLFYQDKLYVLGTNSKKLHCVEPATGKETWTIDLGGSAVFRASPTAAEGRIYCMNRDGDIWVVSPTDGKVLYKTSLDAPKGTYGTIAVTNGAMLIRAADTLYAFGKTN